MTALEVLLLVVCPLCAYVIGATPFGFLIARAKGIDLRRHGSGNVGATNVGRVIGRKWGYLCFLLDVGKGFLPVLAVGLYLRSRGIEMSSGGQAAWLLTALGAVLGHVFTFWLGFKGGKGVATSLGVVLGVWPYFTVAGAGALAVWIVTVLLTRYVSVASIAAAAAFPLLFILATRLAGWPLGQLTPLLGFASLVATLVIVRHRSNLSRLIAGTEHKIGEPRS